ncbi:hypothetical protein CARN8_1010007 [mine drainage metagenome]|uniref:Uncharacterized protein n=1 Tax=mine drainage metagenome TaxID=410659 RepID=A0A3P3ZLB8_9ZZZZ
MWITYFFLEFLELSTKQFNKKMVYQHPLKHFIYMFFIVISEFSRYFAYSYH